MSSYSSSNEPERITWPNKLEYHMSLLSFALGVISFWRFPYLAYDNEGASFLYAFLILFIVVGIPILFLEMAWGQYGNLAPLQAFKAIPAMQGIGISMLFISCMCLLYFGISSYYFLLYLASSFSYPLPWSTCNNSWNTEACITTAGNPCLSGETYLIDEVSTKCNGTSNVLDITSSVQFWMNNLMGNTSVCTSFPNIKEPLMAANSTVLASPLVILSCFAIGRILVSVFALANHVRFTGKVAYLLSAIPFVVLVILLARSMSLSNSVFGLKQLFYFSISDFAKPKLWKDACGQVLLSVMASSGGLVTWSSYNRFYNKYYLDASLLIFVIPVFALLPTIAVYGVIGYFGGISSIGISDIPLSNIPSPMVPLVVYSEALSQMWGDVLPWSIVVFSTFFLASTTATFPFLECILCCLSDTFPVFRRLSIRNISLIVVLLLSVSVYYGVPCFVEGTDLLIIELLDSFSLPLCLMFIAVVETLLLFYCFGCNLLYTNIKVMTGSNCLKSHFWSFFWGGFTPLVILTCIAFTIFGIFRDGTISMGRYIADDSTSYFVGVAGGVIVGSFVFVFLLVAFIKVLQSSGNCSEKFRNAFTPRMSRLSGNSCGDSLHTNGNLFMAEYTTHREPNVEILVDEDIVTTV